MELSLRDLFSAPRRWFVACCVLCTVMACTDASLREIPAPEPEALDNLLAVEGTYCTEPAADVPFPVRVLYIVDQSFSLQCTDSTNLRFEALERSIDDLRQQRHVSFGFVGFSSWSRQLGFTRDRDQMRPFLDPAEAPGPATDYQGSLATALRMVEGDILDTDPTIRARTRYVVVFMSDGVPEPRCNGGCEDTISACEDGEDNDGDGLLDGADDSCEDIENNELHPDNLYGVCNTDQEIPDDLYVDITGRCPEYNQPRQILQRVRALRELEEIYNVGGITLNTVLIFSPQDAVEAVCPGAAEQFGFVREEASGLLLGMADAGGGAFRDVNLQSQGTDDFLSFSLASIRAEQSLRTIQARNTHAQPVTGGEVLSDRDRDGLHDELELLLGTDRDSADSDGDRYRDLVEWRLQLEGLDPLDDQAPALPCEARRDGDGDGLLDCEELLLGTSPEQADSDGDDLLDRAELERGTDPTVADALGDVDFDGISNAEELEGGSNPLVSDADSWRARRVLVDLKDRGAFEVPRENGSVETRQCYDFSVSRVPLGITPLVRDRGLNRIWLQALEGPARISGVPGQVRVACVEAFYQGDQSKNPASGKIDMTQEGITQKRAELLELLDALAVCPLLDPAVPSLTRIEEVMGQCMPPRIELERLLVTQEQARELLRRHVAEDLTSRLPERAYELFVPLARLDEMQDCYRPWEIERLQVLLRSFGRACLECGAEEVMEMP